MKTQFTPGPWEAKEIDAVDKEYQIISLPISGGGEIAYLTSESYGITDDIKREANARLIAAAPDLYEALKLVVAIADRKTDEFDKARAALARAQSGGEGER